MPLQREPAVREVPYPEDLATIAHRLSNERGWCWLDGGFDSSSSWSYLGVASEVRPAERGRESEFLESLQAERLTRRGGGFFGGWVAAFGYEFGVALLGIEPAVDTAAPAFALRIDVVLAVNHEQRRAELRGPDSRSLDAWWDRFGGETIGAAPVERLPVEHSADLRNAFWRRNDEGYVEQVETCKKRIGDGDAYVLCLTDTVTAADANVRPLELYLRVRAGGGATRGAVIVAGSRALISASPERFLSVAGGEVSTHPIKGTRPRGNDPEADHRLARELRSDMKERSENLMIVDLMRNDLSRVCVPGTVRVEGFLRVESHPHVHQLVSTVTGTLRPGSGVVDALRSTFPGGSMTGAPKHRAVEILAELEAAPRALYSGCFGWIDAAGDAELAMTIRSVELRGGTDVQVEARIGAGGGITADSDPESELREKYLKAVPLLTALRATAL